MNNQIYIVQMINKRKLLDNPPVVEQPVSEQQVVEEPVVEQPVVNPRVINPILLEKVKFLPPYLQLKITELMDKN
jgi:hypothetical protein